MYSNIDKHTIQFDICLHYEGVNFIHKRGKKNKSSFNDFLAMAGPGKLET